METLIFIGFAGLIILLFSAYAYYSDKKRKEAVLAVATELGLEFFQDGSSELQDQLSAFKLFNSGRAKKLTKLIRGDSDEVRISIFDYQYTTGHGKQSKTHYQSVASLQSNALRITDFLIRPEGIWDKVGGAMGFQDIDFDSHPNFSKMFVLQGSNEEAVRAMFKPAILEYFEGKKGISVEAQPGTIIIYRPGRYVKPPEIKNFMGEAYEVYGAIVDNLDPIVDA